MDLVIAFLGILAILLGPGLLAAGHVLGRGGVSPVLLSIGGIASAFLGILAFLRGDPVVILILYLAAAMAVLMGALLLFIRAILSLPGWGRRGYRLSGAVLLAVGGPLLVAAGCMLLLFSLAGRQPAWHHF